MPQCLDASPRSLMSKVIAQAAQPEGGNSKGRRGRGSTRRGRSIGWPQALTVAASFALGHRHHRRRHHPSSLLLMPHTLDQVSGTCPATLPHAVCPPLPRGSVASTSSPTAITITIIATHHPSASPLPVPSKSSPEASQLSATGSGCRLPVNGVALANESNLKWRILGIPLLYFHSAST